MRHGGQRGLATLRSIGARRDLTEICAMAALISRPGARGAMLANSLRELLVCPVCRRPLAVPSTLACGHTICSAHPLCPCSHTLSSAPKPDVLLNSIISLLGDPPDDPALEKALARELTCAVCFALLYEPITTPCQHVRIPALSRPAADQCRRPSAHAVCTALSIIAPPVPSAATIFPTLLPSRK